MESTKKKKLKTAVICALTTLLVIATQGCSKRGTESEGDQTYVTIKGSDTMVHLVSNWAEEFMKINPGIEVSVTGGGSGTGIAALLNGTTDICAASRKIKNSELKLAIEKNIYPSGIPNEFAVARDGIAVVVNPANPISELSMKQLEEIFAGPLTKWSRFGGPDEKIEVLSRESSSGTYVFFQKQVLNKKDYMQDAKLLPATSAIIQSVSMNDSAIGYVGLGYAIAAKDKVKILAIKADDNSPAIIPSEKTVKSGEYVIARPLYLYFKGSPKGILEKFIDFCMSEKGQQIVKQTGYVAVK